MPNQHAYKQAAEYIIAICLEKPPEMRNAEKRSRNRASKGYSLSQYYEFGWYMACHEVMRLTCGELGSLISTGTPRVVDTAQVSRNSTAFAQVYLRSEIAHSTHRSERFFLGVATRQLASPPPMNELQAVLYTIVTRTLRRHWKLVVRVANQILVGDPPTIPQGTITRIYGKIWDDQAELREMLRQRG